MSNSENIHENLLEIVENEKANPSKGLYLVALNKDGSYTQVTLGDICPYAIIHIIKRSMHSKIDDCA